MDNYKEAIVAHRKSGKVTESDSDSDAGPVDSSGPDSHYGSPTSVSDLGFPPTSSQDQTNDILRDFYKSDSASSREEDILLRFYSDSGAGTSRKPGERYTEIDFDFLDEKWLEITDESSDEINCGSSGSTDR